MNHDASLARATALGAVETALGRLRVLAGALVTLWVLVRGDRGDFTGSMTAASAGIAVLAVAVAVNVLSRRGGDTGVFGRLVRLVTLSCDATLTVVLVHTMNDAYDDVIWAALVVPVLEGALHHRMRGLIVTWASVAVGYVGLGLMESLESVGGDGQSLQQLQTSIQRVAVVLLVAVPAGYLNGHLTAATAAHALARARANARSRVLETVVDAARSITSLDHEVGDVLAEQARRFGFVAVDIIERDHRSNTWRVVGEWVDGRRLPPFDANDLASLALHRGTVIADSEDERVDLAAHGLTAVVMTPMATDDGTASVLRAGVNASRQLLPEHVEALELLAGQASVALHNRRLVTQLQALHQQLEHQAHHDALTGLPNRERFHHRLAEAHAHLAASRSGLAVLFLDLDGFKEVNDTFGHDVGDDLLFAVAARLRRCLREPDECARLGGDEFTILITGDAPEAQARQVAERVTAALAAPFRIGERDITVSTSIGGATASQHDGESGVPAPTELMRRADLAMYRAKARGPGQFSFYSDEVDQPERTRRERVAADLATALATEAFQLVYQPVVSVATGQVVGAEALVRWQHPARGVVPPAAFIPIAEDTGLIHEIGWWVLSRACADWSGLRRQHGAGVGTLAVNVSPLQLTAPEFSCRVLDLLASHRLPAGRLVLEITERALLGEDAAATIAALRSSGVRVAVDDFGTGHASLSYLQRVRVDILKIDRSYLRLGTSADDRRTILRTLITLAHELGMTVVAEGVETEEDLRDLALFECDAAQGFLLHAPLTSFQLAALVGRRTEGTRKRRRREALGRPGIVSVVPV